LAAVVAPGFLTNLDVIRWLNGIEPAWTVLELGSFNGLRHEPSAANRTIRLEPNLTQTDLSGSAIARNAQTLLRRAADTDGLKLTATGNLSRVMVAEMCEIIEWPDYDKGELFRFNKVINETDFLPLHFIRVLTQAAKLFRTQRGKLVPTRLGKRLLVPEQYGALQAILFRIAFWHINLAYFDRRPLDSWPQNDVGIALWALSASASDWLNRETLTRLCTVPVIGVLESAWDLGSSLTEARIMRPLMWFGLLEYRSEPETGPIGRHLYRKTPLFDRFVKFAVQIERPDTRH
jgi:hypothetical protein